MFGYVGVVCGFGVDDCGGCESAAVVEPACREGADGDAPGARVDVVACEFMDFDGVAVGGGRFLGGEAAFLGGFAVWFAVADGVSGACDCLVGLDGCHWVPVVRVNENFRFVLWRGYMRSESVSARFV